MRKLVCSLLVVVLMVVILGMWPVAVETAMGANGGLSSVHQIAAYVPGAHGTVTPATQNVTDGGTATIVISPATGYHLVSLTIEGHAISPLPSGTYVIAGVTTDHVIGAAFGQDGIRDTVTIAAESYPASLFPLISDSAYTSFVASFLMANPVGETPRGELYGDLCSTVPTLDNGDMVRNLDGTVVTTVRLRPGLTWSDGQPLNIDDYIFSHELCTSHDIQVVSVSSAYLVTNIQKLDDLTCRVTWKTWDPYIPIGWSIYPKHILGPIFDASPAAINTCDYAFYPVHAGPYVLESRVVGQSMTFVANPFYWQPGKPYIPHVTVRYIDNTNTLLANMLTGQIDVSSESLPLDLAQQFEQKMGKDFNVYYNKGTTAGIMEWNLTTAWFKDVRVRQSFYYGIDRKLITQMAMVGTDAVLSPLSSGSAYFKPVLAKYTYDPDKANALLDAAGWKWNAAHTERILPDGTKAVLKVSYSQGATFRIKEVTLIQPMLAKLGITVEHDPMDFNALLDAATAGTFIINLHGITFDNYDAFGSINQFDSYEIPTQANGMQGQNNSRYNSPEMNNWIDVAQKAGSAAAVTEAYSHIQDIFAEDLPCFYLEQRVYPDEVRKELMGYDHFFSTTVYCNWDIQDWSWSTYSLTVSLVGSGSVSRFPDQPSYDPGTVVTLAAVPTLGSHFVGWTGAAATAADPLKATVTMDADKAVTATFQLEPPPSVTLSSPTNGATVSIPTVTLSWSSASGATGYNTALDTSSGFTKPITWTTTGTSQTTDTLTPGATYYWRVASVNAGGTSVWSPVSSFTIRKPQVTLTLTLQMGNTRMLVSGSDGTSESVTLDAAPVLGAGNRTLVPVRAVAEAMGGTVDWNATTRTATVKVGSNTLELTLGKNTALFNGTATPIDTDPKVLPLIINGRTMLPLRFVVESLGAQVFYDQATKTITITYTKS